LAEDAVTAIAAQNESRIEFPNNRLLAELCGEFDRNLTTIETHHAIQIVRRGNLLLLVGDADGAAQASAILQSLYTRLEQGRPVTPADVTAELRMNMAGGDAGSADQQMEMFRSGAVEIKTRKKLVEPRTEAQKAYVEALFKNELSFGIGPAGTGRPIWPSPWACRCLSQGAWIRSSCHALRWKPGSVWGFYRVI